MEAQRRKTADFHLKSHFPWRKSATKLLCVKTVRGKVVRHSLAYLSVRKWLVGATPSNWNFGSNWPRWSENADDFLSLFARSGSAVTPSEKSSINANRKSTTRFIMSPRWTSYVVPKPPKGAQKRKTAEFRLKSHFARRKSATKFLCVKTVCDKVVEHSLS